MQGHILGSGTGIPSLTRNAAGYHLEAGGEQLLIDCGSATLLQLERVGKSFRDLDALFITHVHPDHIGDLIPLIHAMRLPGLNRVKPFTVHGPPGFAEFFARYVVPVAEPPAAFPWHVVEAPPEWTRNDLVIRSFSTPHSSRFQSRAYRFEWQGACVVFSGDTDDHPELPAFCQEADLLFLECSTLDAGKVDGHLSAGLCGRLARQAGAKRLILTHFYPIDGPDSLFLDECRRHYAGPVSLARDLDPFTVTPAPP
ncbi:MAG: MBL fold metallo-hydrolase [Magnetococcales bacterium]|nr:MBL fold metallo-hydrolase [Magnetococcales bacterium]